MEQKNQSTKDRLKELKDMLHKADESNDTIPTEATSKKAKKRYRPSDVAKEFRHAEVWQMFVSGYTHREVIEALMTKYDIAELTAEKYIKESYEINKHVLDEEKEDLMSIQLARYQSIYRQCNLEGKHREAIAVLKELDKLFGLGTTKIDVTSNGQTMVPIVQIIALDNNGKAPEGH